MSNPLPVVTLEVAPKLGGEIEQVVGVLVDGHRLDHVTEVRTVDSARNVPTVTLTLTVGRVERVRTPAETSDDST